MGVMKDKLHSASRRLFCFVAPAVAVLVAVGCATSQPPPPGITQVGPYEVRLGSMVPAPLVQVAENPAGALSGKANDMADSMFTQPIDDPFIFSVQANSWLQAFAGPNKVSGAILDGQNYYRKALGAWNNPWEAVFALRGR